MGSLGEVNWEMIENQSARVGAEAPIIKKTPDEFVIKVYQGDSRRSPVAAVQFVCPSNKAPEGARFQFAMKCHLHLHRGNGLVIVDVLTSCSGNIHNDLVRQFRPDLLMNWHEIGSRRFVDAELYAVSYQPQRLELSGHELVVGGPLPTL